MTIPEKIGRYQIVKELGRGGMATVYQGHDPRFKRDVAIKVLPAQFNHDPTFRARFQREAETIAALEHPAIVPVYDFGEQDEQPYLVMRLMTGGSLGEKLNKGSLPLAMCVAVLERIGSALARAHSMGVIHRDLKPDNILFDQYGEAYLSDFGIVRLVESGTTLTGTGVVGTPAYMSPEQIQGHQVDGRTDIYSLGIILFEMLTGQKPFDAQTPAMMLVKQMTEQVPRVLDVSPDLPPVYETVISRATAKDVAERYQSVGEMTETITRRGTPTPFTPTEPIKTADVPTTLLEPVQKTVVVEEQEDRRVEEQGSVASLIEMGEQVSKRKGERRPLWQYLVGLGLLLAVLVGAAIGLMVFFRQPEEELAPSPEAEASELAAEFFEDGIPVDRVREMGPLLRLGRGTIEDMALSPDGRSLLVGGSAGVWFYNLDGLETIGEPIQAHEAIVSQVAWSPDGQSFISGSWDGTLRLWDVANRQQQGVISYEGEIISMAISAGGYVASASWDGTVQIWDVATGRRVIDLTEHPVETTHVEQMAWSGDGRYFVTADGEGNALVWNPASWQVEHHFTHEGPIGCTTWSPDSTRLALCGFDDGIVRVWDVDSEQEVLVLGEHEYGVSSAVWSADGSQLLTGDGNGTIRLWDGEIGRQIRTVTNLMAPVKKIIWLPEGDQILVLDANSTLTAWSVDSGQMVRDMREHTDAMWGLVWSPEEDALAAASADGTIRVWREQDAGAMPTVIEAHEYGVYSFDWSPDGALLISAGGDGLIKTWDTAEWQPVDEFVGSDVMNEAAGSLDWSPYGDYLAIGDLAGGVWVLALENGEVEDSWSEQGDQISMVAWSPDESQVAAASRDGTILLGNRDEGTAVLLEGHSDQVTAVAWSPDGDRLASASFDQTVRVWDVESGEVLFVLEGHHELVTSVAWSPNGEIIASGGWDWNVHLWNAETGRLLPVLEGHVAAVNSVAWSPDGSLLASASDDGTAMIWGIREGE